MGLGSLGAAILSIKILTDASDAAKGMGEAASGVEKMQAKIGGLVGPAALVGGAMVGMGKAALGAASDHEQAMGGIDTVFGKSADQVKAWGDQAAKTAGLSSTEYAEAAAKIGSQLKTAGVPMDQIADKTKTMIQQGADLSATYGGSAASAVDALSSAMRGEADPAERLGLGISAAAVAAEMAAEGTDKLTGKALTAAKAQATMNLITKQGAASLGQFAAQSGTAAEAQQIAGASMKNLASTMGQALLPAATAVGQVMAKLAEFVQQNSQLFLVLAGIVASFAGGILAVSAALKIYQMAQTLVSAATKVWAGVQWLLNAAMSANPIALVVIAIVALIAVIVLLWTKSDAFRNFFIGMWKAIQTAAVAVWKAIVVAFTVAMAAIKVAIAAVGVFIAAVWTAIKLGVQAVGVFVAAVWTAIKAAAAAAWTAIKVAVQAVGRAIIAVWTAIKVAAAAAWTAIKVAVQAAGTAIKVAVQAVGTAAAAVWTAIKTSAAAVWKAITTAVRAMQTAITLILDGIRQAAAKVWTAIGDAAKAVWKAIGDTLKTYVDAWKRLIEGVVATFKAVFEKVAAVVKTALDPVTKAIQGIKQLWDDTVGKISDGIGKVTGWISGIVSKFKKVPTAPPAAAAPAMFAASPSLSAAAVTGAAAAQRSSTGPTIIIQGAVDPDGTARQIRGILAGRERRVAGIRVGGMAAIA
jgi:phage-related protein